VTAREVYTQSDVERRRATTTKKRRRRVVAFRNRVPEPLRGRVAAARRGFVKRM
jgi:hypothetical protein